MKCPFKKIVTVDTETDWVGQTRTSVDFGSCDYFNCMAAIVHTNIYGSQDFKGCKLLEKTDD